MAITPREAKRSTPEELEENWEEQLHALEEKIDAEIRRVYEGHQREGDTWSGPPQIDVDFGRALSDNLANLLETRYRQCLWRVAEVQQNEGRSFFTLQE